MAIRKILIENFKIFKHFELEFSSGVNILVGDNEVGKTTVIEAIHLALTGMINGKPLNTELTQYLFNNNAVEQYLKSIEDGTPQAPPIVRIELFFNACEEVAVTKGTINSLREDTFGISLTIAFDNENDEYSKLLRDGDIKTLPIEYYEAKWATFADKFITTKSVPIKSALVDSSLARYQNGSDIYISRIVRQSLEQTELVRVSQAHRRMREHFMGDPSITAINERLQSSAAISDRTVELSVELLSKNTYESSLMTDIHMIQILGNHCTEQLQTDWGLLRMKRANCAIAAKTTQNTINMPQCMKNFSGNILIIGSVYGSNNQRSLLKKIL